MENWSPSYCIVMYNITLFVFENGCWLNIGFDELFVMIGCIYYIMDKNKLKPIFLDMAWNTFHVACGSEHICLLLLYRNLEVNIYYNQYRSILTMAIPSDERDQVLLRCKPFLIYKNV